MIDLLSSPPSAAAIGEILRRHPVASPLPPQGDRRWERALANPVLAQARDALLIRARREAGEELPPLTDALYRDYAATGSRNGFEAVYFERRRRVARAAFRFLAEGGEEAGGVFLARLEGLFAEESWALPAHVADPSGRDAREIDLFAAETANLFAECLALFGDAIPLGFRERIRTRLRRGFFERYRDGASSFSWIDGKANWNAVCHQGLLGAALGIEEDAGLVAALLAEAARHLPCFLDGYGADGACPEGPGYWDYGFGWFAMLNQQLEARTGGELTLFGDNPKVRAIAAYGPAVSLAGGGVVNFADALSKPLRPSHLAYLGERLGDAACRSQAAENYRDFAAGEFDLDAQRSDLFFWLRMFLFCPHDLETGIAKGDVFFGDLAIWVIRGRDGRGRLWELAAKGGHNGDPHNHNDVGSFLLHVDGIPLLVELGMPDYNADSWGPKRYQALANRSLGHSLPVLNGQEQQAGAGHASVVRIAETNLPVVRFKAELAGAYPPEARCAGFVRRLALDKEQGTVSWEDEIVLGGGTLVESALIVEEAEVAIVAPDTATVSRGGVILRLVCGAGAVWDRVEIHPFRGHGGIPRTARRLVLVPSIPASRVRLSVLMTAHPLS